MLAAAVLLALAAPAAHANANSLELRAPREVVVGKTFYVTVSGKTAQLGTVWVYFAYDHCVSTAHEEAVRGYPSFHHDVGPRRFKVRSKRIARRADTGHYCAYLYPRGANARSKPLARATRKIKFRVPDIPSQGRRPVGHNADGSQQLFMIRSDGVLFTKYQLHPNSATWSRWRPLPGHWPAEDAIGVGRNKDGRQQIYVVGSDRRLWTARQTRRNRQVWSRWVSLGSPPQHRSAPPPYGIGGFPTADEIGVGSEADGRQRVYLVADYQLYTQHQRAVNDGWTSHWMSLGSPEGTGLQYEAIGVGRNIDGRAAVYMTAYAGQYQDSQSMYTNYQTHANSDSWFAEPRERWISLGGSWQSPASIAVGSEPDGRQTVFAMGRDPSLGGPGQAGLYTETQDSPGAWRSLGYPPGGFAADDSVGIGRNKDGRQQIYAINAYYRDLYTQYQLPTGGWSTAWSSLGAPHGTTFPNADAVSVGRNRDGREQLYVLGADGVLYTKRQTLPNSSSWDADWVSLGGSWPTPTPRGQEPGCPGPCPSASSRTRRGPFG
jgi:hypothetical protein